MCLLSLFAAATIVMAADNGDPPDRVARLSFITGDVSLQPAGTQDWAPAVLNRPLTTDDQLWVDAHSRAELQTGDITIHLDQSTAFSFSELSDDVLQARITGGAIHVNVRRLGEHETVEIDTPQAAVTLTEPGNYHIEVLDDGARTLVKNYDGECEVAGNRDTISLHPSEQLVLDNSGIGSPQREASLPHGAFDSWADERNARATQSEATRYVAPDVIGYQDLDDYGNWMSEPDYGYVWFPTRIAASWAPYRYGHWIWISPWGWTWVDDAPWGFAPFHYGRWAHIRGRWGWIPGPLRVRAVYAPALVAWVGGPNVAVSVSLGPNIGWFPLAPREVYVPGYRCSRRYIHNVNYANTVIVNNTIVNRAYVNRGTRIDYRNRNYRNAITVTSRTAFVSARPVDRHLVAVREREVRDWHARGAAPTIAPDRRSTLGPRWNGNDRAPRGFTEHRSREVVVRHNPPPPRASFAPQQFTPEQRAIRANDRLRVREDRPYRNDNRANPARNDRRAPETGQIQMRHIETPARDTQRAPNTAFRTTQPQVRSSEPATVTRDSNERRQWQQRGDSSVNREQNYREQRPSEPTPHGNVQRTPTFSAPNRAEQRTYPSRPAETRPAPQVQIRERRETPQFESRPQPSPSRELRPPQNQPREQRGNRGDRGDNGGGNRDRRRGAER